MAGDRAVGQSGSRAVGQPGSRAAGQPGSRAAGQPGSRAVGRAGSRAVGGRQSGGELADPPCDVPHGARRTPASGRGDHLQPRVARRSVQPLLPRAVQSTNRLSLLMPSAVHTAAVPRSSSTLRRIASRSPGGKAPMRSSTRCRCRCSAASCGPDPGSGDRCSRAVAHAGRIERFSAGVALRPLKPSISALFIWVTQLLKTFCTKSRILRLRIAVNHARSATRRAKSARPDSTASNTPCTTSSACARSRHLRCAKRTIWLRCETRQQSVARPALAADRDGGVPGGFEVALAGTTGRQRLGRATAA